VNIQIRKAITSDRRAIREVVRAAFGNAQGPEIVDLVKALLDDPSAQPVLSLVACTDRVVGHILFTRARIESAEPVSAAILAPLAVHPDHQGQGIGGRLITGGLAALKTAGVDLVFVLGHPAYYLRYGFEQASLVGFEAPYPIPLEHAGGWMVQGLGPDIIGRVRGRVACANALDDPKHWRE
jgi:putative acetyltransferase